MLKNNKFKWHKKIYLKEKYQIINVMNNCKYDVNVLEFLFEQLSDKYSWRD